jgi:hypothetical protein
MREFDIECETRTVAEMSFTGNQECVSDANDCVRAFRFRFLGGNVNSLPKYIRSAIAQAGYTPVYLGGTTYKYSVVGLKITAPDDERRALNSMFWCIQNIKPISERLAAAVARFPELKNEFSPRLVALRMEASS